MEVILMIPAHEIIHDEQSLVHEWRVGQLTRLGILSRWPMLSPPASTGTRTAGASSAAARTSLALRIVL